MIINFTYLAHTAAYSYDEKERVTCTDEGEPSGYRALTVPVTKKTKKKL